MLVAKPVYLSITLHTIFSIDKRLRTVSRVNLTRFQQRHEEAVRKLSQPFKALKKLMRSLLRSWKTHQRRLLLLSAKLLQIAKANHQGKRKFYLLFCEPLALQLRKIKRRQLLTTPPGSVIKSERIRMNKVWFGLREKRYIFYVKNIIKI